MLENEIRKMSEAIAELIVAALQKSLPQDSTVIATPSEVATTNPLQREVTEQSQEQKRVELIQTARELVMQIAPFGGLDAAKEALKKYDGKTIGALSFGDVTEFIVELQELTTSLTK